MPGHPLERLQAAAAETPQRVGAKPRSRAAKPAGAALAAMLDKNRLEIFVCAFIVSVRGTMKAPSLDWRIACIT